MPRSNQRFITGIVFVWTTCGLLVGSGVAAEDWTAVRIQLDPQTVLAEIPDDFLGFGYETSAVAQAGFFNGENERMIRLYRNLGPRGLIRIGGNVSDHTRFEPTGASAVESEQGVSVINQSNLNDLGDFVRATGWNVMWGLNLATGSREQAVDEALAVEKALGPHLHSFEIGNEVDLMQRYARDYDAYHAAYSGYKAAIRARLPRVGFSGPDSAGNWSFVEKFVARESGDMKLVTHHYYRSGAADPKATLEYLLARDERFDARLQNLQDLCAQYHLTCRINEANSFSGGGKPGVSDTFGSALWCLDYLFDLVAHRCGGVNMETDVNHRAFISHYSPIVHDAKGICTARPEYYGMIAFAMTGHGHLIKPTVKHADINLTAYATNDATAYWLIAINKDFTKDARIEVSVPADVHSADVYRLEGPSINATSGVKLGRAAVSDEGTWQGAPAEHIEISNGAARLLVPHTSAALLQLRR